MHVKGTKREKFETSSEARNVHNVKSHSHKSHTPRNTLSSTVKNAKKSEKIKVNSKTTSESTEKTFLGQVQINPPPPNQAAFGTGSGEDMKLMLSLMSQLVQILQPTGTQMSQPHPVQILQPPGIQMFQSQPVQPQHPTYHQLLVQPQQVLMKTQ